MLSQHMIISNGQKMQGDMANGWKIFASSLLWKACISIQTKRRADKEDFDRGSEKCLACEINKQEHTKGLVNISSRGAYSCVKRS